MSTLKIFVSWSGERSKAVALALKDWLPDVLQNVSVWMSEHDMDAGSRWSHKLAQVLEDSRVGIICLTPENQKSRWLQFEAGALSRSLEREPCLIPYLIDMSLADVEPPLSQFQAKLADEAGTLALLHAINSACDDPLPPERLERIFTKWWPDFGACIEDASGILQDADNVPIRSERDILSEVLKIVRSLDASMIRQEILSADPEGVEIDTRPLLGNRGRIARVKLLPGEIASNFLDKVYVLLNRQGNVPAFTYGSIWLLKNSRTDRIYDDIGIEYCRTRGAHTDETPVAILDIERGDRLSVIRSPRKLWSEEDAIYYIEDQEEGA